MARMPGALWKPVNKNRPARRKGRGICLHVAVSEAASLQGFFSGSTADSHFYVRKDGTIEQMVDTDLVAYANAAGNSTLISVETQGGVTNADGEPWTPQQVDALARICRWASDTDGFPLQPMPDSRPTSRGVGYHRLGCKPWVVAGGEVWSSSVGKICPGAAKIAQIPQIIAAAAGGSVAAPPQEDEMNQFQQDMLYETLRRVQSLTFPKPGMPHVKQDWWPQDPTAAVAAKEAAQRVEGELAVLRAAVQGLADAVAKGAGLDPDDLKAFISSEVDRAKDAFRDAVAEGYEVRLEPKRASGSAPA